MLTRVLAPLRFDPHAEVILRRSVSINTTELRRSLILVALFSGLVLLAVFFVIGVGAATTLPLTPILLLAFNPLMSLFYFANTFIFAIAAAILASDNTRSGMTPLLMLANINGRALYQGYFLATFYRLQLLALALI